MSDSAEEPEPRTEEELAHLRQARFGHLPARISPQDLVESEDVESVPQEPGEPMVRREWG